MAGRIRSIKPELMEDDATAGLSDAGFRAFISILLLSDDHGLFRANPKLLEGAMFWGAPGSKRDIQAVLQELSEAKLIQPYVVDGQPYGKVRNWAKHQRVDKPGKPRCPLPPDRSTGTTENVEVGDEIREVPGNPRKSQDIFLESREWLGISTNNGGIEDSRESRKSQEILATDHRPPSIGSPSIGSPTTEGEPEGGGQSSGTHPVEKPDPLTSLLPKSLGDPVRVAAMVRGIAMNKGGKESDLLEAVGYAIDSTAIAVGTGEKISQPDRYFARTLTSLLSPGALEAERARRAIRKDPNAAPPSTMPARLTKSITCYAK